MYFDRFDIVSAWYAWLTDNHMGQWSREYERLCKLQNYFVVGMAWRGYDSLSENGQAIYDNIGGRVR